MDLPPFSSQTALFTATVTGISGLFLKNKNKKTEHSLLSPVALTIVAEP